MFLHAFFLHGLISYHSLILLFEAFSFFNNSLVLPFTTCLTIFDGFAVKLQLHSLLSFCISQILLFCYSLVELYPHFTSLLDLSLYAGKLPSFPMNCSGSPRTLALHAGHSHTFLLPPQLPNKLFLHLGLPSNIEYWYPSSSDFSLFQFHAATSFL